MYNQKNVLHAMVGKYLAPKASGNVFAYSDLTDGQLALVDSNNAVLTAYSSTLPMRIALRIGTSLLFTPEFTKAQVVKKSASTFVEPVQQVTYIGYNGASGAIEAINSNEYIVRILLKSTLAQFANKQMLKFGAYASDASATQQEVAHGVINDLLMQFKNEPEKIMQFDLINSCALSADFALDDGHALVTNGINTITATTTDFHYNTATAPVVGDYVRISGASATGSAVTLTDPVYKITAINAGLTEITLDRNVTNVTGTYTHSAGDITIIPAGALGTGYGIKMTGIARNFVLARTKYEVHTFEVFLQDFGTTVVTDSVAGKPGTGYGAQIAEIEWFAQGNWGKQLRQTTGYPPTPQFAATDVAGAYFQIHITYKNDNYSGQGIVQIPAAPAEILVAISLDTDRSTDTHCDTFNGYLA